MVTTWQDREAYRKARDEIDSAIAHIDHAITRLAEQDISLYNRHRLSDIAIDLNAIAERMEVYL